jgi:hypothetical protein
MSGFSEELYNDSTSHLFTCVVSDYMPSLEEVYDSKYAVYQQAERIFRNALNFTECCNGETDGLDRKQIKSVEDFLVWFLFNGNENLSCDEFEMFLGNPQIKKKFFILDALSRRNFEIIVRTTPHAMVDSNEELYLPCFGSYFQLLSRFITGIVGVRIRDAFSEFSFDCREQDEWMHHIDYVDMDSTIFTQMRKLGLFSRKINRDHLWMSVFNPDCLSNKWMVEQCVDNGIELSSDAVYHLFQQFKNDKLVRPKYFHEQRDITLFDTFDEYLTMVFAMCFRDLNEKVSGINKMIPEILIESKFFGRALEKILSKVPLKYVSTKGNGYHIVNELLYNGCRRVETYEIVFRNLRTNIQIFPEMFDDTIHVFTRSEFDLDEYMVETPLKHGTSMGFFVMMVKAYGRESDVSYFSLREYENEPCISFNTSSGIQYHIRRV